MKLNKWEKLKRYINSLEVGSIIYRKDLFKHIHNGPPPRTSSYGSTVDNYRRCLTLLGILHHMDRGKYRLCYHMREDLTSTELKTMAYGGFRSWFNDIKITKEAEREQRSFIR